MYIYIYIYIYMYIYIYIYIYTYILVGQLQSRAPERCIFVTYSFRILRPSTFQIPIVSADFFVPQPFFQPPYWIVACWVEHA